MSDTERSHIVTHSAKVTKVDYGSSAPLKTNVDLGEEFVYSINPRKNDLTPKPPQEKNSIHSRFFTNNLHTYAQKVSTLVDAGVQDDGDDNLLLLSEMKSTANWRCGFCLMSILTVVAVLLAVVLIVYNLFFLVPHLYVDQVQLYHLPISDRVVGFRILLVGVNFNVVNVQLESAYFQVSIVDTSGPHKYNLETPIEFKFNQTSDESILVPLGSSQFKVEGSISLSNMPTFPYISDLIIRNVFVQYVLNGQISLKIGFQNTPVKVERVQQYRLS
ncbi:hypothetical protein AKO1_008496 [Acrasis kona]|uniref:Late embryogenesis abundant protein LEA-2 subgroup domain-containing protein n=1 Tax=Acrasis kona TaxID=1008807 RepID=A0AAW2YNP9_9EUKA